MRPTAFAAFVLLLVPAAAQTSAATPPHVLVETVGPDGWRARFAPTNLGNLLASERGRELWQPGVLPLVDWLQETLGEEPHEHLLAYGGRIRLGVWLRPGDLGEQGPFAVALVLEGDGRTDLQALATHVRKLQGEAGGEWRDLTVDGASVPVLAKGADRMTAPIAGEQHLLCVVAAEDDLAVALADARAFAGRCDGEPPPFDAPALRLEVATDALVGLARTAHEQDPARGEWPTWRALGFEGLGRSHLSLTTAGPRVQLELAQTFTEAPQGVFAALFRTTAGIPPLQRLLSADRSSWKVGRFDALALYDAIEAACAANEVDVADMRKSIRDELGVDLRDDLLAHLTDEVLLYGATLADFDRLERTPWQLAFRVKDRVAFAANLATALANGKPALTREATVEHGDAMLWRYGNVLGYDLWFAIGGDLFVLAGGEDAEERLKKWFDAAAAAANDDLPEVPAALADVRRHLPPGLHGAALGDLDSLAAIPLALWPRLPPGITFLGRDLDLEASDADDGPSVRELLQEHRLDRVRTATGYADHTWRWRVFW